MDNTTSDKRLLEKNISSMAETVAPFIHDEAYEKASATAVLICFAIKYAIAVTLYIILKRLDQSFMTDLLVALVFGLGIYRNEQRIAMLVKQSLVREAIEKAHVDEEEDTQDSGAE